MSNYYILMYDSPWAGPVAKRIKGVQTILMRGRLENITETFEYLLQVDRKAPDPKSFPPLDFQRISGQCLFSKKFQNALFNAGVDDIQYFPATVIYEPTNELYEYKVANVIGVVKALDIVATECNIDEDGFVNDFKVMALDENKITPDLKLFRLFEMRSTIVISKHVADILKPYNLSGIRIIDPADWKPELD